ncbi:MAG: ion channel, partial [Pseudobdellovibrionaceae bacterium]
MTLNFHQKLRLFSIFAAMLVGFWFPLKLLGYPLSASLEIGSDLLVSLASVVNVYLFFIEKRLSYKVPRNWFHLGLLLDVICIFPFALIEFSLTGSVHSEFLFLNFLTTRHVFRIKGFLDHFDRLPPVVYRLVPLLMVMPGLVHLIACGWIYLGSGNAGPDPDVVAEYIKAVYWTVTTLTTVGYGDIAAKTLTQMLYANATQIIGVGVFGYILSNVASLIARADAAREHHMDNLDKAETFMKIHDIPSDIRSKVRSYYHYLWQSHKGYRDKALIFELPKRIQAEMVYHINRAIIGKVPFLKVASQEFIQDLMIKLEHRIYIPGEKVFAIGDPGDAMYFVSAGEVEILSAKNETVAL